MLTSGEDDASSRDNELTSPVLLISVAVPRPLNSLFTYRVPDRLLSLIRVGGCVRVQFGRSLTRAFVVEPPRWVTKMPPGLAFHQLKEVLSVEDSDRILPADILALCRWAHDYYCVSLGEVLNCAGPGAGGKSLAKTKEKRVSGRSKVGAGAGLKREVAPVTVELNFEQKKAVSFLDESRVQKKGSVALLQGVTGSGKTEVYIEVAKKVLAENQGVLILVPEIALTPQLHQRFEERLGIPVALWHSAVAAGKRKRQGLALLQGELKVVIGARSAVFAPIQNLGLIVVDEEHDPAYKQEDRVRYQARDLAIVRGKLSQSLVVLGSATPSLETLERVREGRFLRAVLSERVTSGGFPHIHLIDLRVEERVVDIQSPLALTTVRAMQEVMDAGEQVIVYLNRRGFAAFLLCKDCGDVTHCPQCSVSLTVHKKPLDLRCHQCGFQQIIPDRCTKCQGSDLQPMGGGTESLEDELARVLTGGTVLRLDRDQVTSATRLEKILADFRSRKANILLGTQMLVKGHDFPGVTLVVVILADALFRWPDFRAHERAFQILKQVSGRSGRGEQAGRVLIQTYDPDHPVLQVLDGRASEESFLENERELRQLLIYPPFGRLARLRFEGAAREDVIKRSSTVMNSLSQQFKDQPEIQFLGPSEAFLERVRGIFRWDILIKAKEVGILQRSVWAAKQLCDLSKWPLVIDIDPQSS